MSENEHPDGLEPCPFCETPDTGDLLRRFDFSSDDFEDVPFIECTNCHAMAAADTWNTRPRVVMLEHELHACLFGMPPNAVGMWVAGDRCTRSLADLARAAEHYISAETQKLEPDNALVSVLCDTVRLTREATVLFSFKIGR